MPQKLVIAGLGNPGPRYAKTRHNAGFMLADMLAESLRAGPWKIWENSGEYSRIHNEDKDVFIIKPSTYMNDSGRMVSSFCSFHKIPLNSLIVCYDDISIDAGRIRIRKSGSAGGQKGMESVISALGTQEMPRVRIGIGPKPQIIDSKDFVLSAFTPQERKVFQTGLEKAAEAVKLILESGIESAMNRFNGGEQ